MATNSSEHLGLHLWEPTDQVLRTEFNENWQKLDAAAAGLREDLTQGLEEVTARCVEMKRDFVQSDELDRGARQMLNLGHTFGHAVEASSRFTLSHGKSVAIGMAMILRAACSRGLCSAETRDAVIALLQRYGLPTECPYPADMLLGALSADKKIFGTRLNLVVPTDIGACRLLPVGVDELSGWLRDGGAI